jgi:hypothetical protein
MFSSSDDNAMMKRILETHAPDGREIDAKPLLQIVEDIFHRAAPGISGNIIQVRTNPSLSLASSFFYIYIH